jgi:hypothetical protein
MVNENDEAANTEESVNAEEAKNKPVKKKAVKKKAVKKAAKKTVKKTATKKVAEKSKELNTMSTTSEKHFPLPLYMLLAAMCAGLLLIYSFKHQEEQNATSTGAQQVYTPVMQSSASSPDMAESNNAMEPPAWVKEYRAEMKERASQNTPEWVKEQRSQMEEQMKQRQMQMMQQNQANQNGVNQNNQNQSEPPAWMKQRQAQMNKWAAQQRQWASQQPQWNPPKQVAAPTYAPSYYYPPQQARPVAPGYGYGPYYGPAR